MSSTNNDTQILNSNYILEGDEQADCQSDSSDMNSHRRTRSHNVGNSAKQSKSERKGGRMLMMKNRLNNNSTT